jgi:hypothetical protein
VSTKAGLYVVGLQRNTLLQSKKITLTQCEGSRRQIMRANAEARPSDNGLTRYLFKKEGGPFGDQSKGLFGPKLTGFQIQVGRREAASLDPPRP